MMQLGGLRDAQEFRRRLAVTAALLVLYRLGTYLPLPGINPDALAQVSGVALERLSIFALGTTPFITLLILAELLKVLAPRVRIWEQASPRNHYKLNRIVVGLSLLAAAVQASGLTLALEDVPRLVVEPGTRFRLTGIATLVGGTAIIIWLADQITRHGIGSGVWLLFITPWLAHIPSGIASILTIQGFGMTLGLALLTGIGLAALVIAATVALIRAGDPEKMTVLSLWSVLLAKTIWPWLILVVALVATGGSVQGVGPWLDPSNPILVLALAGLLALCAHLYLRSQRMAGAPALPMSTAVAVGGLAAIFFVEFILATQLGAFVPLAAHLVVVTAIAMSILVRWWDPPPGVSTPDDQSSPVK